MRFMSAKVKHKIYSLDAVHESDMHKKAGIMIPAAMRFLSD